MIAVKHRASISIVLAMFLLLFLPFFVVHAESEPRPTEEEIQKQLSADQATAREYNLLTPNLQVKIPGLNLENSVVIGNGKNGCGVGFVCANTIERYLNGVYKFAASAGVTFAIVLIMVGGAQYAVGSAAGSIEAGKKRMTNAVIGLVLVLSVHAILTFVNPDISSLKTVKLEVVQPIQDTSVDTIWGGERVYPGIAEGKLRMVASNEYIVSAGQGIHEDVWPDIQQAAKTLKENSKACVFKHLGVCGKYDEGTRMALTSGGRGIDRQAELFIQNCLQNGGKCSPATCNPFARDGSGSIVYTKAAGYTVKDAVMDEFDEDGDIKTDEGIVAHLVAEAVSESKNQCPHSTGFAVDVWCEGSGDFVADVACHLTLERAMKEEGWCRLKIEPWHFEYQGHTVSGKIDCNWEIGTMTVTTVSPEREFNYGKECRKRANFETGQCVD